jgi:TatD DNase family protein
MRGKRNEPAYVVHTAAKIAQLRGVTLDVVARETRATALRIFRVPH